MGSLASREQIIDYAMRKLGAPVVEINVDYQQAEDRLDEALEFFTERHFDGVERCYFKHQITSTDITNRYISTINLHLLMVLLEVDLMVLILYLLLESSAWNLHPQICLMYDISGH